MNVESLQVYLSDKAIPIYPPYDAPHMRDCIATARLNRDEQRLVFTRETTRRYFLAGGGDETRFEELWGEAMNDLTRGVEELERGLTFGAGGAMMYVIAARKI